MDKNTDVGAINSKESSRGFASWSNPASGRCRDLPASVPVAGEGVLVRADGLTNVAQSYRIAQEEIFGPSCPS